MLAGIALASSAPETAAIWVADTQPPFEARAPLDFRLDIGRFLYLQVGTPGGTVDTVSFDLGAIVLPDGPPATQAWGSGVQLPAVGGGVLDVVVRGNGGTISLSASNNGAGRGLSNGAGGYISYREIVTLSDDAGLPAPVLTDAGSNLVQVAPTGFAGLVTDRRARWSFRFANTAAPPPGSYRGQVTYTASAP